MIKTSFAIKLTVIVASLAAMLLIASVEPLPASDSGACSDTHAAQPAKVYKTGSASRFIQSN